MSQKCQKQPNQRSLFFFFTFYYIKIFLLCVFKESVVFKVKSFVLPEPFCCQSSETVCLKSCCVSDLAPVFSRWSPGGLQVVSRCQLLHSDQVVLNISQTTWLLLNCLEPLDQRGSVRSGSPVLLWCSWSRSSWFYTCSLQWVQEWSRDRSGRTEGRVTCRAGRAVTHLSCLSPAPPAHPPADSGPTGPARFHSDSVSSWQVSNKDQI